MLPVAGARPILSNMGPDVARRIKGGLSPTPILLLLIAVLWLATHPYQGLTADARFYMVQALHALDPTRFADDIYFRYGSQDQFTIFTSLYAPLVKFLGVGAAGMVMTVCGQLLWLSGLIYLSKGLIPDRFQALLAVCAVIALPDAYALFSYGEPFITPRLFAEALTLISLALIVRRHTRTALVTVAVAAALHPLTALPGIAFLFLYLALARPLWWWIGALGVVAVLGLGLIGVRPFANLTVTYDAAWFEIVHTRDAQCLITAWRSDGLFDTGATLCLALLTLTTLKGEARRFLMIAMIVGVGGIVCTFIGADVAHNVFVTELQPWRALWLLALVARLFVVPMLVASFESTELESLTRATLLAALLPLFTSKFVGSIAVAAPIMAVAATILIWQLQTRRQLPAVLRLICLAVITASVAVTPFFLFFGFQALFETARENFWRSLEAATVGGIVLGMIVVMAAKPTAAWRRLAWPLAAAAVLLVPAVLMRWDQRTSWTKFIESEPPIPANLASAIPPQATVYWEGGLEFLWFDWKRSDYISCSQGTGAVFFRDTALEYEHRLKSLWPLRTLDFAESDLCANFGVLQKADRTKADLQSFCAHEPSLDYVVLVRPIDDVKATVWTSPVPLQFIGTKNGRVSAASTDRFYIYSCASII